MSASSSPRRFAASEAASRSWSSLPACWAARDADVTAAIGELFRDEGIEVSAGTTVERVAGRSGERVRLQCRRAGADVVIEGTDLLVAAGRPPNADGIGVDVAGVELDSRGHVRVN